MNIYQRLNHVRGLIVQRPKARYRVLYPNFQRTSVACIVDAGDSRICGTSGFISDTATYYLETEDRQEAQYLCAILNSPVIDSALTPLRRGDQAAHPNVHKKVFDLVSIPTFNNQNSTHHRLAELCSVCQQRVAEWVSSNDPDCMAPIGKARNAIRNRLANELAEINALVIALLFAD